MLWDNVARLKKKIFHPKTKLEQSSLEVFTNVRTHTTESNLHSVDSILWLDVCIN